MFITSFFVKPTMARQIDGAYVESREARRKAKESPRNLATKSIDSTHRQVTPPSHHRLRVSSTAPSSRGQVSIAKNNTPIRRSRRKTTTSSSLIVPTGAVDSLSHRTASSTGAKSPDTALDQGGSLAPVAVMGALELLPYDNIHTSPATEVVENPDGKPSDDTDNVEAQRAEDDGDLREILEIASLVKHRMADDQSGTVELLVHWVDGKETDTTWEDEAEIQRGAQEMLYAYWAAQGGRQSALFHKPENPPAEMYHVYDILRHIRRRGGPQFEIQWVGHSAKPHETTIESETKVRDIAPRLLDEYWNRVRGGRTKNARVS
ncbi:hypothetical protein F5Y16DRAFT_387687 [Xylariaceae sp. FL0255]|nr:hypothetical protein F5Y16DRAFT_387687 [Xylariaceae sp. FL0255]